MSPNVPKNGSDVSGSQYEPRLVLGEGIIELLQDAPRGDVYSFGATPLDSVTTLVQQSDAFRHLRTLAQHRPDNVPEEIGRFVFDTFRTRFINRGEANDENFTTRIIQDYEAKLEPHLIEIIDRAKTGHASPAELILIRDLLGIRSVELACLTHPYGEVKTFQEMRDALADMRDAVHYGVVLFEGEAFNPPIDVRFKVKEIIGEDDESLLIDGMSPGVLMTRKRKVGELSDGTIVRERSSFILRLDRASWMYKMIGPERVEALKSIQKLAGVDQENALREFQAKIEALLDMNEFEEAIPVSSTIYAFNKDTKIEVARQQAERERQNQVIFEEHNPKVDEAPLSIKDVEARQAFLASVTERVKREVRLAVPRRDPTNE